MIGLFWGHLAQNRELIGWPRPSTRSFSTSLSTQIWSAMAYFVRGLRKWAQRVPPLGWETGRWARERENAEFTGSGVGASARSASGASVESTWLLHWVSRHTLWTSLVCLVCNWRASSYGAHCVQTRRCKLQSSPDTERHVFLKGGLRDINNKTEIFHRKALHPSSLQYISWKRRVILGSRVLRPWHLSILRLSGGKVSSCVLQPIFCKHIWRVLVMNLCRAAKNDLTHSRTIWTLQLEYIGDTVFF